MGHDGAETNTGGGRQDLVSPGRGKLELAAMAGALSAVARSHMAAVVAVKWVMASGPRPYDDK